jgi:hypothetical protein
LAGVGPRNRAELGCRHRDVTHFVYLISSLQPG